MKLYLIILALACTTLYSGIIFGWAPLQLILEEDGVYSSDCEKEEECTSQQKRFSLLYTLATSVFMFGGFISGICVDYYGPTKCTIMVRLL
jgi:MFS transporter, LAT3 family, solute carrier family 43, member 3